MPTLPLTTKRSKANYTTSISTLHGNGPLTTWKKPYLWLQIGGASHGHKNPKKNLLSVFKIHIYKILLIARRSIEKIDGNRNLGIYPIKPREFCYLLTTIDCFIKWTTMCNELSSSQTGERQAPLLLQFARWKKEDMGKHQCTTSSERGCFYYITSCRDYMFLKVPNERLTIAIIHLILF